MIELTVNCHNYELEDKISEYVEEKIGELDKLVPRAKRDGLRGTVTLTQDPSGREDNQCACEVTIQLPGTVVEAHEATLNMFAAVDIVEAKLKAQLLKYKAKHAPKHSRAKVILNRLHRQEEEI